MKIVPLSSIDAAVYTIDGDVARFQIETDEQPRSVAVAIDGSDLHFFPERSASQRELLKRLFGSA